ncbi:RidA family protein [Ilumatobacter sp.]|uniref:RidA family protein n=1 Tax=Ilumatobacter sp. TaxID=1967498 RepID=UPI003AF66246
MNEAERAAGLAPTPGYRYADVAGDELFVAGQVPHDGDGRLVGAGAVDAQADQCVTNLFRLVDVHGFERQHVRRLVIYVVGDDLAGAWAVVRSRFDGEVPPATLLGVAGLGHPGQLVEIDATIRR